jgi:hypothetical protein
VDNALVLISDFSYTQHYMNTAYQKLVGIVAAVVVVVGGSTFLIAQKQKNANPEKAAKAEAEKLVASVGKLMTLPEELPIVATVVDPSKLQGQAFFANAQKGDRVLIYNQARKAVLYNPGENRIVDVAPLSIGPSPTPSPAR